MALTDKLTAIANAIRAKDGSTATMTLDQMPEKIAAISGSPIVDENLENTVQYRQMNATVVEFIDNVDYAENANDYSTTKVTPYYSATTADRQLFPCGLRRTYSGNSTACLRLHKTSPFLEPPLYGQMLRLC